MASKMNFRKIVQQEYKKDDTCEDAGEINSVDVNENSFPLNSSWKIYDHQKSGNDDYDKSTRYIGSFDSVITFWQYFNHLPLPSNLFYQSNTGKPYYDLGYENSKPVKREISSISIFRGNILPKWEDPVNKKGGEVSLRKFHKKQVSPVEFLDQLWENLVLSCIGESFELSEEITGLRVVDSSVPNKPLYRIEMWFSNLENSEKMEKNFRKILNLGPDDKIYHKNHGD